jgi:hypothetical protein
MTAEPFSFLRYQIMLNKVSRIRLEHVELCETPRDRELLKSLIQIDKVLKGA